MLQGRQARGSDASRRPRVGGDGSIGGGGAGIRPRVGGLIGYRADIPQRMAALLEADPEFGLAHCLKGYFAMLCLQAVRRCRWRKGRG